MTNEPSQRREPTVAAVVVTRNGARWLPDLITSLSRLQRAPQYWHAVDIASTDGSADILRSAFADHVSFMASGTGFGSAVSAAVAQLPDTEWLWLIHDDMSVTQSALANLLEAGADDDIAVVGPKVREWPSLRRLVEVGLTITGTAHRETGLETGEPDDGQHDRPVDVLAVGSAGMLVRRSVWDELGGFDESLRLFFDDIDFGWRVNNAGYRVRTAPQAVCFHVEASARGTRPSGAGDVAAGEQRRAGIYTALVNATPAAFWWQYVRLLGGSLLRFLGLVVVKDVSAARQELWAVARVYGSPRALARSRRARRKPVDKRRVRELKPPPWLVYVRGFETVLTAARAVARPETVVSAGRRSAVPDAPPPTRDDRPWWSAHPWLASVLALIVLSVAAGRGVLGPLHGGALLPAPASTGHWWSLFFAGWHDVGVGSAVAGPPYVFLLAVVATPVWFAPGMLITALVVFAVPISALTAHRFALRLNMHRGVRIAWAITYAAAVAASGALSQGRLGTIIALIMLPVVAGAVWQLVAAPSWQAGIRLGLWTAVAAAFAPIVYLLTVVVLIGCAIWARQALRWAHIALAIVIPWPLLAGWLVERAVHPFRIWQEAGFAAGGDADALDVLFGRGGGIGAAPGWMSAGLIVLAVFSLLPAQTRRPVTIAWLLALLGLLTAAWGMTVTYTPAASTVARPAWIAVPAVLWLGGLGAACALAARQFLALRAGPLAKPAIALAVLAAILPGCTAVWWLVRGVDDPLTRDEPDVVPAYVAAQSGRALVLSGNVDDGLDIDVVRGSGPVLGDEAVQTEAGQLGDIAQSVRQILTDADPGAVKVLADHGITSVYAPYAKPLVARRLDAMPDLAPAGSDRSGSRVWHTEIDVSAPDERSRPWNSMIAAGQTIAWLIVIVLAVPGRNARKGGVRQ